MSIHQPVEPTKFNIYVKFSNGERLTFTGIKTSDSVKKVKERVQVMKQMPLKIIGLTYKGTELEDDKKLSDYDINDQSICKVLKFVGKKVTILIKEPVFLGILLAVDVNLDNYYSIDLLLDDISHQNGYPKQHMHLFLVDNLYEELKCYESVSDSQICTNIIENGLVLKTYGCIQIKNYNDNGYCKEANFVINVDAIDNIEKIKNTIKMKKGIPLNEQKLYVNHFSRLKELPDQDILHNYNLSKIIKEGLILHTGFINKSGKFIEYLVLPKFPIKIFIKTLTGKTWSMNCDLNDTIEWIKFKIQIEHGIPPDQHRIILKDKQGEDHKTLNSYNITNESILVSVLTLRG